MASPLAEAHIVGQQRLRAAVAAAVAAVWRSLPAYDRENVDQFLTGALPAVLAGQRKSVALTEAYLARALERQLLGVDVNGLVGAAVRNGTPPETVYFRPFVQLWAALGNGMLWEDAVAGGLSRSTSTAETDVQLSSRATFQAVQDADPGIQKWRRVADSGACQFCRTVNGAIVLSANASPLHNRCGCSLEPVPSDLEPTPIPSGVAVHEHGELGAVLTDPSQAFTGPSDF